VTPEVQQFDFPRLLMLMVAARIGAARVRSREKLLSATDFIVPAMDQGGGGTGRESVLEVL
jgi:hypothetical protein